MKCTLCGYQFRAEAGQAACKGCPLAGGCNMIKCPNCGYDIIPEPGLIKLIKSWGRKGNGIGRKR